MTLNVEIAFLAALVASALGAGAFIRQPRSVVTWLLLPGMVVLALESALIGMALYDRSSGESTVWWKWSLISQSLVPGIWIAFSLVYARGNYREFLNRWKFVIAIAALIPPVLAIRARLQLKQELIADAQTNTWVSFESSPALLFILLLIGNVLVIANFEKTFRSAVGTMRWRVKFVVLGLAILFGARVYTQSQALLFSGHDVAMPVIHSIALLIACVLIIVGYVRTGFDQLDIYPSRTLLQNSATVAFVGGYLLLVGVLAQVVKFLGGIESFQSQAFVVLLGIAGLSILLCSDRARLNLQRFISSHLRRPEHDFRSIWTQFSDRTSSVFDPVELCTVTSRLISDIFNALSVTVFLADRQHHCLAMAGSTSPASSQSMRLFTEENSLAELSATLREYSAPFNLEKADDPQPPKSPWVTMLREATPIQFDHGGDRYCVPMMMETRLLGVIVLADRVNGLRYTQEELDILKCLGNQVSSALLNRQLSREIAATKEMEAFQTMSTFFVHDMKNLASRLRLMLENLPVHFEDPEFRKDALRSIASTSDRINQLVSRLSSLRKKFDVALVSTDLNQLITETVESFNSDSDFKFLMTLQPIPHIAIDRDQIATVLTNLLINAREAVVDSHARRPDGEEGKVNVATTQRNGSVFVSVEDNGCGMTQDFLENSLFRPFKSTKQKGLGIGMFQSKAAVEAHRGDMRVTSIVGVGTTVRVRLPIG